MIERLKEESLIWHILIEIPKLKVKIKFCLKCAQEVNLTSNFFIPCYASVDYYISYLLRVGVLQTLQVLPITIDVIEQSDLMKMTRDSIFQLTKHKMKWDFEVFYVELSFFLDMNQSFEIFSNQTLCLWRWKWDDVEQCFELSCFYR